MLPFRTLSRATAFVCAALAVFGAATARGGAGDALPDAKTLLENVAAAAGKLPENETRTITYTSGATPVILTVRRIGDDERTDVSEGPIRYAYGTAKGQSWHQNENGQTVLDREPAGNETEIAYTATVSRVATPVDGYLLSSLDARGYGEKVYVEAATMEIVRRESIAAKGTTLTTYSDFRTIGGHRRAFAWSVVRSGHTTHYTLQSDVVDANKPGDVATPGSRRALLDFPSGRQSVELPAQFVDGRFLVRVTVEGRGLDFLLDSGAAGITIDENVATQLGLTEYGTEFNSSNAHTYAERDAIVPEMKVGPIAMHDVVVTTIPDLDDGLPGSYKVVGLLGFDFIAETVLKLDYEAGKATVYDPDSFAFAPGVHPAPIEIRVGDSVPTADVSVNGKLGEHFIVDTGAQGTILVDDYFMRRYPDALAAHEQRGEALTFRGVGGDISVQPYLFKTVEVGPIRFEDFLGYRISNRDAYETGDDGVIGSDFLQYFTVYFDYGYSHVYFERNHKRSPG